MTLMTVLFNVPARASQDLINIANGLDLHPMQAAELSLKNEEHLINLERNKGFVVLKKSNGSKFPVDFLEDLTPHPSFAERQENKIRLELPLMPKTNELILRLLDLTNSFDHATVLDRALYRENFFVDKIAQGYEIFTKLPDKPLMKIPSLK